MMLPCQVNDGGPHRGEMNSECLAVAGLVPAQMTQDTPSQLLTPDPATRHAKSPGFNVPVWQRPTRGMRARLVMQRDAFFT